MPNRELIEYSWNEITEIGDLTYESPTGDLQVESTYQPLSKHVAKPTIEAYWQELKSYLATHGAF